MLSKDAVQDALAEDVDFCVNLAIIASKARGFFKKGDAVLVLIGWSPGAGFKRAAPVP